MRGDEPPSTVPRGAPCPWILRLAAEADVEPAVSHFSGHMDDGRRRTFRAKLERYVRKPDRDLIIAVNGEGIVGLCCIIESLPAPHPLGDGLAEPIRQFACCTGLLVDSRHRRLGIGAGLVRRGEEWARERGKAGLWLVTHRAASWYARHFGYQPIARVQEKGVAKTIMAKCFSESSLSSPAVLSR
ncbi:MAG TPA: GNAT family N-acetyltransferase [Syntrophobacteria bacterium]|nr:GNAT family N-acetyltransferase [Syntrophobacteria bacterium]